MSLQAMAGITAANDNHLYGDIPQVLGGLSPHTRNSRPATDRGVRTEYDPKHSSIASKRGLKWRIGQQIIWWRKIYFGG